MRRFSPILVCLFIASVSGSSIAAQVIMNEYNAVSGSNQLDDGDGADPFFGTIDGNGGNWFELLVIDDLVDMRGWKLVWEEDEQVGQTGQNAAGTITLSDAPIWSGVRSGTIITFIETDDANGEGTFDTSTDLNYNPLANDWRINVATREEQIKGAEGVTSAATNDGSPGDFSVGKDDWTLTIWDKDDQPVFGPAGEGVTGWPGDGVGNEEGGSLEAPLGTEDPPWTFAVWQAVTPTNPFYDDTGSTSFGAANVDYIVPPGVFESIQDLSALRSRFGDFDHDGALTAADIDAIATAVQEGSTDRLFDLNVDGDVTADDRLAWVNDLKNTWVGDANLDLEFNSSDMVAVFATGKYETGETASWSEGDWNGDLRFGTSDMVAAFAAGGYERGQKVAAVGLVPEPTSLTLVLWGLLFLLRRRPAHIPCRR